jgi:hypothetical protein
MLLASFGSPSALGYATSSIVRRIGSEIFGTHLFIQASNLEEFRQHWHSVTPEDRKCVILFSDCPHREMAALIANVRAPIVMVVEDFVDIFLYVRRSRGMAFAPVVRFTTQVICALNHFLLSPNVKRISPGNYRQSLASFVQSLVSFYGAPCGDIQFAAIMEGLAPPNSHIETLYDYVRAEFPHVQDHPIDTQLSPVEKQALAQLSEAYGGLISGSGMDEVDWPVSMFLNWDVPGAFLDGPIELLGPGRFIICGPYLHLPEGEWRMSVEIEVEECFSDNQIGADIFSERILTAISAKLPASGRFGFDLDFRVVNSLAPVEIRMQLSTGAIEGRLSLVRATLTRRSS